MTRDLPRFRIVSLPSAICAAAGAQGIDSGLLSKIFQNLYSNGADRCFVSYSKYEIIYIDISSISTRFLFIGFLIIDILKYEFSAVIGSRIILI